MSTGRTGHDSAGQAVEIRVLLRRARDGNSEAFATVYRRYQTYVLGCFLSTGAAYDTSWDLMQETFLHALRGLHTLDLEGEVRFRGWLSVIARNVARKHAGRLFARKTVRIDDACFPDAGEQQMCLASQINLSTEEYSALARCLEELGIELRRTVLYKFFMEYSNRRIATIVGSSEATVRGRLGTAMTELRGCLESKGVALD